MFVLRTEFARISNRNCGKCKEDEIIENQELKFIQSRLSIASISQPNFSYPIPRCAARCIISQPAMQKTNPTIAISVSGSQTAIPVQERPECSLSFQSNTAISHLTRRDPEENTTDRCTSASFCLIQAYHTVVASCCQYCRAQ